MIELTAAIGDTPAVTVTQPQRGRSRRLVRSLPPVRTQAATLVMALFIGVCGGFDAPLATDSLQSRPRDG